MWAVRLPGCLQPAIKAGAALRRLLAWVALACGLTAPLARASAPAPGLERQVKAAYLYKFAGFVEWPEASFKGADSVLTIGVSGSDVLAEQLERIVAGRNVNGRPIAVRRIRPGDALPGLHILFADQSMERAALGAMLAAARAHSVLTVTDAEDGLALGAMIGFVVADERLRFDVALRQAQASGLRISARMLAVAHKVKEAS